jgi:hypothetical protein
MAASFAIITSSEISSALPKPSTATSSLICYGATTGET